MKGNIVRAFCLNWQPIDFPKKVCFMIMLSQKDPNVESPLRCLQVKDLGLKKKEGAVMCEERIVMFKKNPGLA